MPSIPSRPNVPSGGTRQQKAEALRAEMEAKEQQPKQDADDVQQQDEKAESGAGPVGEGDHIVEDGECISSIAKDTGHFWDTLWNDPGNAVLNTVRQDPNVLLPGDRVTIPELRPKEESGETEVRHRFLRRGEPAKLKFRLLQGPSEFFGLEDEKESGPQEDHPRGGVPYKLVVDGQEVEGIADADGWIECPVPGNARSGTLILNPGEPGETEIPVALGRMSPITEIQGIVARLENLGFQCGGSSAQSLTGRVRNALCLFQQQNGLPTTGEPDEETRAKLVEVHGS